MKVALIVGARPQFIKAAPLLAHMRDTEGLDATLIHSGQHFDENMSEVFFRELGMPAPDHRLGINSGPHGAMTGRMLEAVERCLTDHRVDAVVVFGDTNTTLAGALAAAKMQLPVAHVEAGLRSWNRSMPEELNRVLVDHASTWLFCPTDQAVANLAAEGITEQVHAVGDIMFDAVRQFRVRAAGREALLAEHGLAKGEYFVLTLHRAYNTGDGDVLEQVLAAVRALDLPVLFPVHPRTRALLDGRGTLPANLRVAEPLGYLDMLCAVGNSRSVLTDSGGLQKEAYFLGVPCVTLRPETEWVETVAAGWNVLAGTTRDGILEAVTRVLAASRTPIPMYGDGHTAEAIVRIAFGASASARA